MSTFIQEFAKTLLNRYNNDLSNIVVMFPSLRARVFFNDAISTIVDRPLWQPSWSTIDELMERGSGLIRGERIRLISELFKVYNRRAVYGAREQTANRYNEITKDNGKASECIACGQCEGVCPQHIEIISLLEKIKGEFE